MRFFVAHASFGSDHRGAGSRKPYAQGEENQTLAKQQRNGPAIIKIHPPPSADGGWGRGASSG